MVRKDNELTKNMTIHKLFKYENNDKNIVHHIEDFYKRNCYGSFIDEVVHKGNTVTAREVHHVLQNLKDKKFAPRFQVVDVRNKCKYIITSDGLIVPTRNSGSIYNLQIIKSNEKYIDTFEKTLSKLNELYEITKHELPIKPDGVYFDGKSGESYDVIALMTKAKQIVPIKPETISHEKLKSLSLLIENKPLYDKIDKDIEKGKENSVIDDRINDVQYDKFYNESYELFRLEFSDFITKEANKHLKAKLESIMNDSRINKHERNEKIRLTLYRLMDKDLYERYQKLTKTEHEAEHEAELESTQKGGSERLINQTAKLHDLIDYQVKNDRYTCTVHKNKDVCSSNPHCKWAYDECHISLTDDMIVSFINKISEELASNDLKANELMKNGTYFVSDIVDYNKFTERSGQKIIRSSSNTIKKVLGDLFGKENVPKIGKRRGIKTADVNYVQMNVDNHMRDMKEYYSQHVVNNNLSIFRAYVNSFHWVSHPFYDNESRNLGYYSPLQTELSNYFRSLVTDWLQDPKNKKDITETLIPFMDVKKSSKDPINDFIIKLSMDVVTVSNCVVELYVLNKVQRQPIVVYDDNMNVIHLYDNGIKYLPKFNINNVSSKDEINKYTKNKNVTQIKFGFFTQGTIPDEITAIYLL